MKKLLATLILVFSIYTIYAANGYDVAYNQPVNGEYELVFDLGEYDISEVTHDGVTYSNIDFESSVYTMLKGYAHVPFINASIQLGNKNVTLEIIEGEYEDYTLTYPMLPSRGVIYRDQDPSTIPYEISSSSLRDEWYPQDLANNTSPFIMKDVRGTSVYVYPFRYNAVQNVLRVYSSVTVKLIENETTPVNPLDKTPTTVLREMNSIYKSIFINYAQNSDDLTIGEYGDILVICTDRDDDAIQPYIDWKMEKGYNVSMEVVPTATNVKTLVQDSYNANNDLLYVQLVGDWADIKCDLLSGYAPMDPQLGCVVGTDDVADITVGRISANSAAHVTTQVDKIINYEKNPDMAGTWYKGALGIGSSEGPGDDNEIDKDHVQIIYDDKLDPFTFDDYYTSYQPGDNVQQVYNALDGGISVVNYCGHGYAQGWSTSGFSNNNVASLTNGDQLPWLVSVACNNGDFHGNSDCFAEAWQKKDGGGSVMFLGATISQPWNPPMRGQDYFADILIGGYDYSAHPGQSGISTDEGRTTLGSIVFNGLALMTTESGGSSDWETAKTWHIFGDPSMQPRTDTPDDLTLSNNVVLVGLDFSTMITGSNGPVEGAMVCLSQNGEYFKGVTDATGSVSIPQTLLPGDAQLVVTGFNTETIYETITVVPPGGAYVIVNACEVDDANGNNNGQADYGETVLLDVAVENVGTEVASGVDAVLSTSDPYITISDETHSYGNVGAGAIVQGNGAFEIEIADDTPDMYNALFEVEFTDDSDASWTSTMSVVLHAAMMELGEYTILDQSGNGNGKIDPGETVDISVQVLNSGSSDAYNIDAELGCTDPYVTIVQGQQTYGNINAGANGQQLFTISADINTPAGHPVTFDFDMTGDMSVSASASFDEVIGQIPVLIIDLDGNTNSGEAMEDAIATIEMAAEYTTSFPADLSLYSSVFVCLGIYSDNHVLTSCEGQALATYLNNGGNLYMEGGDTWYYDTQTAVHNMFGINATGDGSDDLGTLQGQTGTFTEGMSFSYTGDNNWIDHIEATGDAYNIFENQAPNYGTGVANEAGNYKTIGCSHEFGGLADGTSTKEELMSAYLEFFGFTNTLTAFFGSNTTEICEFEVVEFYDMSNGDVTSWSWEFEGGAPSTSTFQNPQVMYNTAGVYDVTLTVSDGVDSHSVTFEDYITVNICTDIEEENIQKISIYPNPNNGIFTVELSEIPEDNVTIKVLNSLSSVVYERSNMDINGTSKTDFDLSHLNKGMYFLVFENYQGNTVKRIIIR